MALIFLLSAQPKLPDIPGLDAIVQDNSDKVKHIIAYAVLAGLIWRALGAKFATGRRFALAVVIAVLYGVTDEYHQRFVPNRTCDICDLAADATGALIAAAVAAIMLSRSGGPQSPP